MDFAGYRGVRRRKGTSNQFFLKIKIFPGIGSLFIFRLITIIIPKGC
jgi:hypothetical protein